MWLIFTLGIVSFMATVLANNRRTCVMDQNNFPNSSCVGGCNAAWRILPVSFITCYNSCARRNITKSASWAWGREGWQCTNVHPENNVKRCLPANWLCDGFDGCGDWSDEGDVCGGLNEDTCTNPFTGREGLRCKTGNRKCIRKTYLCDGYNDCEDGSDEGEVCGGFTEDRTCTNPVTGEALGWRCKTGKGTQCKYTYLRLYPYDCTTENGECIKKSDLCDGEKRCYDGSDEGEICSGFTAERTCTNPFTEEANTQTWHCISGRNKCIRKSVVCNGIKDCDDGSDEGEVCGGFAEDRTCNNPFTGEAYGWRCKTGNKKCIEKSDLCNGIKDCDDGTDESEACGGFTEDRTCMNPITGEAVGWRCKTGDKQCITNLNVCDGDNDCDGGEDEGEVCGGFAKDRTCKNPFNGETRGWRCKTGNKKCINNNKLCDYVSDCKGGEDESFCNVGVLQPGCHWTGCHICATDPTILTSSEYWNGSAEECRGCHLREDANILGLDLSNLPNDITWRRCNDGSCYNSILSCDNKVDCLDGSDELNCPWFTRLSATNTLAACFSVVLLCLVIFIVLRKFKVINTTIENNDVPLEISLVYMDMGVDMALELDSVDRFITKMKNCTEMDDEVKEIYEKIHQANQISELISSVNIFFNGLKTSHEITILVLQLEKSIHGSRRQAVLCMRVNAGSNKDMERLLSYEADPGILKKIKKQATQVTDAFLGQFFIQPLVACFPNIKKWSYNFTKMIMASFKVSLFLWDFAKDLILWVLLVGKSNELDDSENFLLWLFFSLIFFAQSIMGLYISTQYKDILSLPFYMSTWKKGFVLIFMFLLTPCLPAFVIFKATVYSTDMAAIVADARNNPSSLPSTVLQQIKAVKEKHGIQMQIYAYARVIEATLETFPQVILLTSTLTNEGGLGNILLNKGNLTSPTSILFLVSLPYSIVMIVTAIIGFINTQKRGSLGLATSSILGMSYLLQLISSMFCWVFVFGRILNGGSLLWNMIMLLMTLIATWLFTYILTCLLVKHFTKASIPEQFLHVLVNTFVTIPYRDIKDEDQRRKSTEIFWHFTLRITINILMILTSGLVIQDSVVIDLIPVSIRPLLDWFSVLCICVLFQLSGGLFIWIFYWSHPWKEINHSRCHFCVVSLMPSNQGLCRSIIYFFLEIIQLMLWCFCCDVWITWCRCFGLKKLGYTGWNEGKFEMPDREMLAVDELVIVTSPSQSHNNLQEDRFPLSSVSIPTPITASPPICSSTSLIVQIHSIPSITSSISATSSTVNTPSYHCLAPTNSLKIRSNSVPCMASSVRTKCSTTNTRAAPSVSSTRSRTLLSKNNRKNTFYEASESSITSSRSSISCSLSKCSIFFSNSDPNFSSNIATKSPLIHSSSCPSSALNGSPVQLSNSNTNITSSIARKIPIVTSTSCPFLSITRNIRVRSSSCPASFSTTANNEYVMHSKSNFYANQSESTEYPKSLSFPSMTRTARIRSKSCPPSSYTTSTKDYIIHSKSSLYTDQSESMVYSESLSLSSMTRAKRIRSNSCP